MRNYRLQLNKIAIDAHPNISSGLQNLNVELTARMPTSNDILHYTFCHVLKSASLYWNHKYGPVRFILDEKDRTKTTMFSEEFLNSLGLPFKFLINYEPDPIDTAGFTQLAKNHRSFGYAQQLYSSYLFDLYTTADVIAWIDTDIMFTTIVTPHQVIRDGKLLVKGMDVIMDHPPNNIVKTWSDSTMHFIGVPMIADFMTYFPVYLWPSTVKNCRKFIMKRFGHPENFEAAWIKASLNLTGNVPQSPVNVILSYAWHFEKDKYEWHIDIGNSALDQYNQLIFPDLEHNLHHEDITPALSTTIHSKYYRNPYLALRNSFCYVQRILRNSKIIGQELLPLTKSLHCNHLPLDNMLLFDWDTNYPRNHFAWCAGEKMSVCRALLAEHDREVIEEMRHGYSLDTKYTHLIDSKASQNFNIKCPRFLP